MDPESMKDMRDYAWNYFSLHADQRIKTFNFYLVLVTFAVGGIITVLKDLGNPWAVFMIGALLAFVSFIFWKLDGRNKELVRHGEEALKFVEDKSDHANDGPIPHVLKIFNRERYETDNYKRYPQ